MSNRGASQVGSFHREIRPDVAFFRFGVSSHVRLQGECSPEAFDKSLAPVILSRQKGPNGLRR